MMIRFFCVPQPGPAGDLSYDYLVALRDTGYGIRAISILGGFVGFEERWTRVSRLFMTPIEQPFLNIVCALPDLYRGAPLEAGRFGLVSGMDQVPSSQKPKGTPTDPHDNPIDAAAAASARDPDRQVVYQPQTAFASLFTLGCPNLAIIDVLGQEPSAHEVSALQSYDKLIAPTAEAAKRLRDRGLDVVHMGPHADDLATLIDDLT